MLTPPLNSSSYMAIPLNGNLWKSLPFPFQYITYLVKPVKGLWSPSGCLLTSCFCPTALNEMGYRLSPQFSQLLVSKYDTVARRALKLDDFIQACVMLRGLTDSFKHRDTNLNGTITISYEDFMSLVLLNRPWVSSSDTFIDVASVIISCN